MAGKWETISLVKGELLSLNQLEQLAAKAAEGNNAALRDLGRYNEKIGRRMNQRMRELEGAGKTGDAYKRIQESIGGKTRFSQARTGSAEQLFKDAEAAQRALAYKESTLTGIMEVDKKTTQSIFDKLGIDTGPGGVTRAQVQRMNTFFQSGYWKENKKYFTSQGLEQIAEMAAEGGETFNEFMEGISNWISGDDMFAPLETWMEF